MITEARQPRNELTHALYVLEKQIEKKVKLAGDVTIRSEILPLGNSLPLQNLFGFLGQTIKKGKRPRKKPNGDIAIKGEARATPQRYR
jgi:hypothetical protein